MPTLFTLQMPFLARLTESTSTASASTPAPPVAASPQQQQQQQQGKKAPDLNSRAPLNTPSLSSSSSNHSSAASKSQFPKKRAYTQTTLTSPPRASGPRVTFGQQQPQLQTTQQQEVELIHTESSPNKRPRLSLSSRPKQIFANVNGLGLLSKTGLLPTSANSISATAPGGQRTAGGEAANRTYNTTSTSTPNGTFNGVPAPVAGAGTTATSGKTASIFSKSSSSSSNTTRNNSNNARRAGALPATESTFSEFTSGAQSSSVTASASASRSIRSAQHDRIVEVKHEFKNEVRATPDTAGAAGALRASNGDDKRSLRSHDGGSRSRSELAQYFPNWDEIVSNEPQVEEPLTAKTRLHITEEPLKAPSTPSKHRQIIGPPTSPTQQTPSKLGTGEAKVLSQTSTSRDPDLNTFTRVNFSEELSTIPRNLTKDPLSAEHFKPAHQRGERQEKQLKNIEKEKAQHEKVQLERLYEGLLGHDWLRVMGISGITDTEKKTWEQKRDWVLREVKALLDKFERYRAEEKRLREEKEANMQDSDSDEASSDDDNEEEEAEQIADTDAEDDISTTQPSHRKRRRRTNPTPSRRGQRTSTDADTLAAQQLQTETSQSAAKSPASRPRSRKLTGIDVTPLVPIVPPAEEKPFVSFFDKPHLRAAALGGNRRGRSRFAFGHPVPEMEVKEFALPAEMVTPEARKASARQRRLRRRTKE